MNYPIILRRTVQFVRDFREDFDHRDSILNFIDYYEDTLAQALAHSEITIREDQVEALKVAKGILDLISIERSKYDLIYMNYIQVAAVDRLRSEIRSELKDGRISHC